MTDEQAPQQVENTGDKEIGTVAVYLADDHTIVRQGLASLLSEDSRFRRGSKRAGFG